MYTHRACMGRKICKPRRVFALFPRELSHHPPTTTSIRASSSPSAAVDLIAAVRAPRTLPPMAAAVVGRLTHDFSDDVLHARQDAGKTLRSNGVGDCMRVPERVELEADGDGGLGVGCCDAVHSNKNKTPCICRVGLCVCVHLMCALEPDAHTRDLRETEEEAQAVAEVG